MMYTMKKIIDHNELITLPKCMYSIKPIFVINDCNDDGEEININVSMQVTKFLKANNKAMVDLEARQDHLLQKLDALYDKIKSISSACQTHDVVKTTQKAISAPDEIVFVTSPDNLPWFLKYVLKNTHSQLNVSWHIHSTVPNEKVAKIQGFVKSLPAPVSEVKSTLRLIFKTVLADSELKLSSLEFPIVGTVNILRYISMLFPVLLPYDGEFSADALLDLCHILERTNEKNKDAVVKNLFSQYDGWLYKKSFSIVDIAAYNIIKQWRSIPKSVPKDWFEKCDKLCC